MTAETDAEFVERVALVFEHEGYVADIDWPILFALARRGAETQASKGEQRTTCEACGNSNLAHERAAWTDDGTSYCPTCFPAPPKGESDE